jgi:hypothetical protein
LADAFADIYNSTNYFPPSNVLKKTFIPVARTILKAGVIQQLSNGSYYQDLRGKIVSGGAMGATVDLTGYYTHDDANAVFLKKNDFNVASGGALLLGAKSGNSCTTICSNHGLDCNQSVTLTGTAGACNLTAADYSCWCT